jgi:hypothetical protein
MMTSTFTSLLLFLGGALIFVLGNPYYSVFPTNGNQVYYAGLTAAFLLTALLLKRSRSLRRYWKAAYALFMAAAALLFFSTGLVNHPRDGLAPIPDLAVDKFSQLLHIVPIILLLTLLAGDNLKSIFIHPGKWKPALVFGLVSFLVFGVIALFTSIIPSGQLTSLAEPPLDSHLYLFQQHHGRTVVPRDLPAQIRGTYRAEGGDDSNSPDIWRFAYQCGLLLPGWWLGLWSCRFRARMDLRMVVV